MLFVVLFKALEQSLTTPAKCLIAMHLRHKNLLACGAGMLKSEMKQIKAK